jgi:ribose transport system substrate-binding protein
MPTAAKLVKALGAVIAVTALFSIGGCGQNDEKKDPDKVVNDGGISQFKGSQGSVKNTIGVSLLTLSNPFFKTMGDAMVAEGKKHNIDVIIQSGEMDSAKQSDQVNDFIVKGVSAIVLSPCDSRGVGTTIQAANKANIPVFTADIANLDTQARVVTHVATDNYEGGKLAAKAIIEATGGKGKVAIIDHPEVESVIQRTKGFKEVISGAPGIQVVAQLPGHGQRDTSFKTAQDILQKYPNLDAFFCINDPTALGAVAAIEKAGKTGKIKVIGFDGIDEAKKAVKEGKIYADVVQFPDKIGEMTIQGISKYLSGEKLPSENLIPAALYTKADAEKDPKIK